MTTVPWYILTYIYGDFYARGSTVQYRPSEKKIVFGLKVTSSGD